jgi:hypothetical protein
MSAKKKLRAKTTKTKRKLHVDAESRALMGSPGFREILEAGQASAARGLLSSADLDRGRPITDEEAAHADERIAQLEAEDCAATGATHRNGAARR